MSKETIAEEATPRFIEVEYACHVDVDLEELGIDHKQVNNWYIKWHCLHIEDLEGNWQEYGLGDVSDPDWKHPESAWVFDEDYNLSVLGRHHDD